MSAPKADLSSATEFLKQWAPAGPWVLTAIHPFKKAPKPKKGKLIFTETFYPDGETDCLKWLAEHKAFNLYFHVNTPMRDLKKKAERTDIKSVDWLHVDIDPREKEDLAEEQARALGRLTDNLPKGVPAPTVIIFSGGGYQGFWKLEESIIIDGDLPKAEDAKRWNIELEIRFGADNCGNIDRVMRLPGTINWPDAAKLKKDPPRVPTLATLHSFNDGVYTLGAFKKARAVKVATPATTVSKSKAITVDSMIRFEADQLAARNLPDLTRIVIARGDDPEKPDRWGGDRSKAVMYVCCEMIRRKFADEEIMGIITDKDWGISAHVLEQPEPMAYARRQCERAHEFVDAELQSGFETDKKGNILKTQGNIRVALSKLGITLSHDTFADFLMIKGLPGYPEELQDGAINNIWLTIDQEFRFRPERYFFGSVLQNEARGNPFNPVCDYLDGLNWDGTPRIADWISDYGGAESTDYTRAISSLMLVAAVRRVRQPGCKFDEMVIFVNPKQGTNKSSAIAALLPNKNWFSDDLPLGADSKIVIERTAGAWIIEAPELIGHGHGQTTKIKAFLSRTVDRSRMAYQRMPVTKPRSFIVVGSTNDAKFLNDLTGHRRFWPVDVKRFNLDGLRIARDQLWAEAAHLESNSASIRLDSSLWAAAGKAQAAHAIDNPFYEPLQAVLGDVPGKIRAVDCWAIVNVQPERRSQTQNINLGRAMVDLGFVAKQARFKGPPINAYVRGDDDPTPTLKIVCGQGGRWRLADGPGEGDDDIPF